MPQALPDHNEEFNRAASGAEDRASLVFRIFLGEALSNFFEVDGVDISMDQDPETGEFVLGLEIADPEDDKNQMKKFGEMKQIILETLAVLDKEVNDGEREEMDFTVEEAEGGLMIMTTALESYVTLYSKIADIYPRLE